MSWTRLDDGWTDRRVLADLAYPTRWHILCLVQWCSRTGAYDGVLRLADARRASDVPDPDAAHAELAAAGLLEVADDAVRVIGIENHVPPPHMRDETRKAGQRDRKRRSRTARADGPDDTPPDSTVAEPEPPADPVTRDVTRDMDRDFTRDPGTGRDRTGQDENTPENRVAGAVDSGWPAVVAPGSGGGTCSSCGRSSGWSLVGGRCRRCLGASAA